MDTFRWILAAVTGLLWLLAAFSNYTCIYIGVTKKKFVSGVPAIGTLAGIACLLLVPTGEMSIRLWFIPLAMAADPQSWYTIAYFSLKAVRRQK